MMYNEGNDVEIPSIDLLTFLFDSQHCHAQETTILHAEARNPSTTSLTKSDVRSIFRQLAHWLRSEYGIASHGPGKDVVVSFSNGQSALPCLFYGIVAAKGIYSAASTLLSADELAGQIRDGPGKLLVCSEDVREVAVEAAKRAGLSERNVLILRTSPQVSLEAVDGSAKWSYEPGRQVLSWRTITNPEELRKTIICLVYSSGTTGRPKGVRISHANMVSEAFLPASMNRPIWSRWAAAGKPFKSRTLAHLGCAHISGVQGYFVNPLFDGGTVYWMPRLDLAAFLAHNAALKITTFFSLPLLYAAVTRHPAVTDQLASLRIAYSGGLPLDPRVYDSPKLGGEGEDRTLLSQTWGATETTGAATHMPPDRRDKTGSVGVLLPNILMRLVDEHGKDVEEGQPGEAWLKGPTITSGYHNNDEANKVSLTGDGWYRTGDCIEMRGDLLYVLGRVKEVIRYCGHHISPVELEFLLVQHPGVADAAVMGTSWDDSEVPRAAVVLRPGVEGGDVLAQEIVSFVEERVPGHKRLRGGVAFVQTIPRLVSGKICRKKLQELMGT